MHGKAWVGACLMLIVSVGVRAELIEQLPQEDKWAAGYAHQAVQQYEQGKKLRCGFKEHRWHHDFYSHQAWAVKSGKKAARSENLVRAELLKQCEGAWAYVSQALIQVTENTSRGCALSGPEWSAIDASHFSWAMENSQAAQEELSRERKLALSECQN